MKQSRFIILGKFKNKIFTDKREVLFLILVIGLATFFRLWHLADTQFFTYDQARDFIIIKRILIDHKLTLLGPTVLIPGVYLPPFYYYSLTPFLFLFKFHLIGADFYTALLGIGAVFVFYLLVKNIFDRMTAFLASLVFATLPLLVSASRHAWNPNSIHFFSLLLIFFIWKFLKERRWGWFYGSCAVLSWSLNLHLTMLVFIPLLIGVFLWGMKRTKKFFSKLIFSILSFFFFLFPLGLFEYRHGFSITHNVLIFLRESLTGSSFSLETLKFFLLDIFKVPLFVLTGHLLSGIESVNPSSIILFDQLTIFNFHLPLWESFYFWLSLILVVLILIFVIYLLLFKKLIYDKKGFYLILICFILGIGLRLIIPSKSLYFYQYTFLFPIVLLLFANLIFVLFRLKRGRILAFVLVSLLMIFNFWDFFHLPLSQRDESFFQPAGEIIAGDFFNNGPYNYVVIANSSDPQRWDHNGLEYRYLLESRFKLPISGWEAGDYQQAEVLYLVDEGNLKEPLKLGGLEMESFSPQKITDKWQAENGLKIYKMEK